MSGSGISLAICKSAPCSRQPHHSVFYRPDALPAAQPTASKHWRQQSKTVYFPPYLISAPSSGILFETHCIASLYQHLDIGTVVLERVWVGGMWILFFRLGGTYRQLVVDVGRRSGLISRFGFCSWLQHRLFSIARCPHDGLPGWRRPPSGGPPLSGRLQHGHIWHILDTLLTSQSNSSKGVAIDRLPDSNPQDGRTLHVSSRLPLALPIASYVMRSDTFWLRRYINCLLTYLLYVSDIFLHTHTCIYHE